MTVAKVSQPPFSKDAASMRGGSSYRRWRLRLHFAHEVAWVGAWYVGGGIAWPWTT